MRKDVEMEDSVAFWQALGCWSGWSGWGWGTGVGSGHTRRALCAAELLEAVRTREVGIHSSIVSVFCKKMEDTRYFKMEEASCSALVAYIKMESGTKVRPPLWPSINSEGLGIAGSCPLYSSESHRQIHICHLLSVSACVPAATAE